MLRLREAEGRVTSPGVGSGTRRVGARGLHRELPDSGWLMIHAEPHSTLSEWGFLVVLRGLGGSA